MFERIVAAIRKSISMKQQRPAAAARVGCGSGSSAGGTPDLHSGQEPQPRPATAATNTQSITVPIMGEGIRSAKVVALLKKPGDRIELDDALCEVETDKAVYPIESSFAGTMGQWKVEVDDTVEIGQELGTILVEGGRSTSKRAAGSLLAAVAGRGSVPESRGATTAATGANLRFPRPLPVNSAASFPPICRSTRAGMRFAKRVRRRKRKTAGTRHRHRS